MFTTFREVPVGITFGYENTPWLKTSPNAASMAGMTLAQRFPDHMTVWIDNKDLEQNKRVLSDGQYRALSDLYNECNEDFYSLSNRTQQAFFDRLFGRN